MHKFSAALLMTTGLALTGAASADDDSGFYIGAGVGTVQATVFSAPMNDGDPGTELQERDEFDFDMIRVRGGYRLSEGMALEVQAAQFDEDGLDTFLGVMVVPTIANLFGYLDVQFPMGFGLMSFDAGGFDGSGDDESSPSYGVNVHLNLGSVIGALSFLKLDAGYQVYVENNGNRVDGTNFGLRFDF